MRGLPEEALLLSGPTASGKSAVACELAKQLDGEIVSVDSMQVYRGLDVGTAKPTALERAAVTHHMIDVADLSEPFDAARFTTLAWEAIADVCSRGRRPILCGGTGFYFKALLHGLGAAPPSDPSLRSVLEETPLRELLAELATHDPTTFSRIDRNNRRRVVRAIEIVRLTGRPVGDKEAGSAPEPLTRSAPVLFALRREPADLRRRINERVDGMFACGLVAETRELVSRGLTNNRTALQAIGYRQVVEHLRGERDLPATIALVKARTWQMARRQMSWLRHQLPVQWIGVCPDDTPADTAMAVLDEIR